MAQKKPPKASYRARQPAPQPREAKPTHAEQTQRQVRGKARGRDNKSKKIIWIVLIFIFIAFILLNYEGGILMKASDAVRTGISSMGGGAGFPYDINADKVKGLGYYQGNLLALTDNNVTVLSASAKEIKNTNHGFANPTSVVAGGRVLTYDQGGTRLMVENSNRKVFEKTYKSPIIFAALGDDGSFAVATGSKQASSEVTVYSRNIKEAFTWRSSNSYIMNCAVSNNGRYLSVATVTAKDGILVSNVLTFDIKGKKLLETVSYGSSVIAGLHYSAGNRLTVVGDDVLSVITNQKKRADLLKPDEQRMTAMDIAPNQGVAVVYGKFDNSQTSYLTYVTKTGTKKFTSKVKGVVSAVSAGNNYIALLVGNSVLVYNMKGQCVNTIPLTTDAIRLQVIGSKLYLQTYTQITVCSANKGGTKK